MATQTAPRTSSPIERMTEWTSGGWGPVLSGAAAAFLVFLTFSALWLAIAASGSEWFATNLEWWELFTALGAAPIGGFVTGWLQPGEQGSGAVRGFASWGLVLVVALILGAPMTISVFGGATNLTIQTLAQGGEIVTALENFSSNLWAAFAIFGGGGILAAMAGSAGTRGERRLERGSPTA